MKSCMICQTEFVPKMKSHVYCSASCREKKKRLLPEYAERDKLYQKRYRSKAQSKQLMREYNLKRNFGITEEQYNTILQKQGGGCAVCGRSPEEEKRNLAVDHDHKTGEIFGILCWFCNHKLIGKNRQADLYVKAAEYLKEGTGLFVPPKPKRRRKTTRERKKRGG